MIVPARSALAVTLLFFVFVAFGELTASAQFGVESSKGPRLGEMSTQEIHVGIVVTAVGGPCQGIVATAPVPIDWPEQKVRVVQEDFSALVRHVDYRMVGDTVKQMVLTVPYLPDGEEARAVLVLEVQRHALEEPEDTSIFVVPKRLDRQMRTYLGASPGIETQHRRIKSLAKEIVADHDGAWEKVEAIYDWVRENVEYVNGPFKGAAAALRDETGDCEELSSLFIAMCRVNGIPARTVWVPGHCYPEFYLEDDEGNGYWFPCQAAGTRAFGSMPEHRPILQKGDNFQVPERPRERQRYVAEFLTGKGGTPRVKFIRQLADGTALE